MGALMASGKEVSGKIPKGKASIKISKSISSVLMEEVILVNVGKELEEWTEISCLFAGDGSAACYDVLQPERVLKIPLLFWQLVNLEMVCAVISISRIVAVWSHRNYKSVTEAFPVCWATFLSLLWGEFWEHWGRISDSSGAEQKFSVCTLSVL